MLFVENAAIFIQITSSNYNYFILFELQSFSTGESKKFPTSRFDEDERTEIMAKNVSNTFTEYLFAIIFPLRVEIQFIYLLINFLLYAILMLHDNIESLSHVADSMSLWCLLKRNLYPSDIFSFFALVFIGCASFACGRFLKKEKRKQNKE